MRRKIILLLLAVLVLAGLGVWYVVPWYQALYNSPAIRYDHKVFACEEDTADVRRFTDGQSTFTFTPTADGTEVAIDFAYSRFPAPTAQKLSQVSGGMGNSSTRRPGGCMRFTTLRSCPMHPAPRLRCGCIRSKSTVSAAGRALGAGF